MKKKSIILLMAATALAVLLIGATTYSSDVDEIVADGIANDGFAYREVEIARDGDTIILTGYVKTIEDRQKAEALIRDRTQGFSIRSELGVFSDPSTLPVVDYNIDVSFTDKIVVTGTVPDAKTLDYAIGEFRDAFEQPIVDRLRIVRGQPSSDLRADIRAIATR